MDARNKICCLFVSMFVCLFAGCTCRLHKLRADVVAVVFDVEGVVNVGQYE